MLVAIGATVYGVLSGVIILALCRAAGRQHPSDEPTARRRGAGRLRLGEPHARSARG
jgi:hypothetical protein